MGGVRLRDPWAQLRVPGPESPGALQAGVRARARALRDPPLQSNDFLSPQKKPVNEKSDNASHRAGQVSRKSTRLVGLKPVTQTEWRETVTVTAAANGRPRRGFYQLVRGASGPDEIPRRLMKAGGPGASAGDLERITWI